MSNFKYKLFATFFNFFRRFSIKSNKISFIGLEEANINGNLGHIYLELNKQNNFNYNFIYRSEYSFSNTTSISTTLNKVIDLARLFLLKSYHLATSHYIFLTDNFLPLAYMNIDQKTIVVQLWHAAGAFKKFGSSVADGELKELGIKISSKLDYVIVSSKNVAPFYKEAFGVDEEKVLALGIPRTDFYFKNNNVEYIKNLKSKFEGLYPQIKNKKIVLYAPTFRDDHSIDREIIKNFNIKMFNDELSDEYSLMIRLHPRINHGNLLDNEKVINVTDYPDEKELLFLADILITDYSSIMIEYALLHKPIIFYPYDYEYYVKEDRGFYFNYLENVPGPIACTPQEIIRIIKEDSYDFDKIRKFVELEFDELDGKSSQRIINHIIK